MDITLLKKDYTEVGSLLTALEETTSRSLNKRNPLGTRIDGHSTQAIVRSAPPAAP